MRQRYCKDIPTTALTLHELDMGDVEDPYLYAAFPISDWQRTEKGCWCMQHATEELVFTCTPKEFGFRITIVGKFLPQDATFFLLRWGK